MVIAPAGRRFVLLYPSPVARPYRPHGHIDCLLSPSNDVGCRLTSFENATGLLAASDMEAPSRNGLGQALSGAPPPPTSPDLANAALHQLPRRPWNRPLATRSHPGISWAVGEGAMSQIWAVERPQKQKHASSTMLTPLSSGGGRFSSPANGMTPPCTIGV